MTNNKKLVVSKQYAFCAANFFYFCNFIKQQKVNDFSKINIDLILNLLVKLRGRDIVTYTKRGVGYTTSSLFYISYLAFFAKNDLSFLIIPESDSSGIKKFIKNTIENFNELFPGPSIVTIKDVSNIILENSYYNTSSKIIVKTKPDINLLKGTSKPFEYILLDPITTDMLNWSTLHPYFINQSEKELIFNCRSELVEVLADSVFNKTHNFITV